MQERPIKLYSSTRKTREILYSAPTNGKARGFGLRNYWAGSVHSAMKKLD